MSTSLYILSPDLPAPSSPSSSVSSPDSPLVPLALSTPSTRLAAGPARPRLGDTPRVSSAGPAASRHRDKASSSSSSDARPTTVFRAAFEGLVAFARTALAAYQALSLIHRVAVAAAALAVASVLVLLLIYSHAFFTWLSPLSERWRATPFAWLPIWLLVCVTAFPPAVGYSFATTLAGFVYGVPLGWPIVATAATIGSLAAFLASRTVLSKYVHRLVGNDTRFLALGQVLRRDGVAMLTMIRLSPLPFSITNGFLATIPTIRPLTFAAATALASPKLLIPVFIGSRLAVIAEEGSKMSARDKIINYLGMFGGGLLGVIVSLVIYRRTIARAAEIAREEALENGTVDTAGSEYGDREANRLLRSDIHGRNSGGINDDDDDDDAPNLMGEDDISLWTTTDGYAADMYSDDDDPIVAKRSTSSLHER